MRFQALLAWALLLPLGVAQANDALWCLVRAGDVAGAKKAPRITEFAWGGAHSTVQATGHIKTSIGILERGEAAEATTAILLDDTSVPLPPAATGMIWSGKVFDFGGTIAVVFLVETATDSSASPSEALVLIGKGSRVLEQGVISGQETAPNRCPLL